MRRALCPFYFIAAICAFLVGCQPPGPRALLDGEKLIGEGKYAEAIQKLEIATQALPGNAQAWNHLGLAYQYAGKPNEALRAYTQAIALDRNLAPIHFNLGTLHLEQNRLNEAMTELSTASVLDATSVDTKVQLGKAELRARRIDEAERTFAEALKMDDKNVEALNYQGVVQLHRRRAPMAKAYFEAALRLQTNYAPAVYNLATLSQFYIVNKTNALAKYKQYLAMNPDPAGAAAANEAVRVLEAELQPKPAPVATNLVAIHTNRVVAATAPTNAITNRLVAPTAQTNRTVATAPQTNRVVTVVPTNPPPPKVELHTNPVVVATAPAKPTNIVEAPKTNKVEVKVAELPKPEPKITNTPPKTNIVAAPVVKTEPPPVAVEKTEPPPKPVVKTEPPKPLEVVNVDDETKFAAAKDIAEPKPQPAPLKKEPEVAKAPEQPAATNKVAPASAPLVLKVQPEEKSPWLKKANPMTWFKRDKGDKEEKEKVVAKKTEAAPRNDLKTLPEPPPEKKQPEPKLEPVYARYPYRVESMPPAGNRASAEAPFNEAFEAHQQGKLGKAMDGYREAIRRDPRFFDAQLNLGIAAMQSSDLSLALASFEDAVRLDPKSPEARYQFAAALRRANYPQDAANELRALIDETPKEARAYLALANLYAQVLNKTDLAAANYQKVLELAPRHPQAEQIRAWLAAH